MVSSPHAIKMGAKEKRGRLGKYMSGTILEPCLENLLHHVNKVNVKTSNPFGRKE